MSKKILFFDTSNDGHHFYYNLAAIQGVRERDPDAVCCYATTSMEPEQAKSLEEAGISMLVMDPTPPRLPAVLGRTLMLYRLVRYCKKQGYGKLHLLYLDCLLIPLLLVWPLLLGLTCTATMHWYPTRPSKQRALSFFLGLGVIRQLIVHGEYTKRYTIERVRSSGRGTVESILYPQLHPQHGNPDQDRQLQSRWEAAPGPYLLAFGGTRYDKGLDLLMQAFAKVEEPATLVIAGKEEHFTREDIEAWKMRLPSHCQVITELGYIDDEAVSSYFESADLIVLPYRKMFTGQSGPLTEAVVRNKLVIGPDHGEIGFTIDHYQLGLVFRSEEVTDLAEQINYALRHRTELAEKLNTNQNHYRELIQPRFFMDKYGKTLGA
ncbi:MULTISPECIES: glycosyltransferase [Paenibacillus]|uniref:glycosyltransferase n=1 Tax=Paenibacillus TaxID=44249 RepID=UPI0022B914ED|nr:glycosyltransferase [Paenibacillus caseinilyticus]MCZ8519327.1 glycosyltransferase [Paenibacillus caseinilyticus]